MKTIGKSLLALTFATGLLGATAVVAQDREAAQAPDGQGMMDGMQGEGMPGMMGMMSQMSEMMESCSEMMEAMRSRQDTPETEAPRKG